MPASEIVIAALNIPLREKQAQDRLRAAWLRVESERAARSHALAIRRAQKALARRAPARQDAVLNEPGRVM